MALHRINRTEVELRSGEVALARALSDRIGRIHRTRIVPVLDRVCSELSASAVPVRIDRLDLDLGTLAADDLEDAFVARLEPALRAALEDALKRRPGGDRSARDSLELIERFALTGGLPWWALPDREVVARHFARASAEAGAELVALLGRIAHDPGALDRIARLCGRSTLAALVERAQADPRRPAGQPPAGSRIVDDAARRRQRAEPTLLDDPRAGARDGDHRDPMRSELPAVDATAAAGSAAFQGIDEELRQRQQANPTALDESQARAWNLGHRDSTSSSDIPPDDDATGAPAPAASRMIDDEPRPSQRSGPTALDEPPATVAASSAASPGTDDELRPSQRSGPTALDESQARARNLGHRDPASSSDIPPDDDATGTPAPAASRMIDDEPRPSQRSGPTALDEPPATVAASSAASPGTDDELRPSQRSGPTPLEQRRSPTQPYPDAGSVPPRVVARAPRALPVPSDPAAIRAVRRGALARLDEIYVDDAGLVILWPFLEQFFLRAGVLGEDRRFLDEAAQLQAVALVDSLATADPAPLEFRLPLAKLLCGRSFESYFALERPLAPEQLAEGDRLLAAVIDRVPALGEPSITELRTGFLARPGVLGARDGAWLLQVERRSHDTVLEQFPWSWGWVRLPWMPGPLRVEW